MCAGWIRVRNIAVCFCNCVRFKGIERCYLGRGGVCSVTDMLGMARRYSMIGLR